MAVGGPETPQALGQLDLSMAEATAPSRAILGQAAPQVTTRQAPGIPQPGNFSLTVEPQAYSWNPSQADFGQKQVAQIGVDGFNVPVAQRGFPTGAIASRQDALAQRKAQIAAQEQKLMASTDPFKGISDPAPPYRVAGNKLVQSAWSKLIADEAEFYGGDTAEATRALYSTAEGRDKINRFARTMDAVMKENAGRFDNVMDMALRVKEGKTQIEPEEAQLLTQYLNGIDPYTGVPVQGADMEELVRVGRGVDDVMFKEQYADKFLKGFDEFLETSFEPGEVQRLPGNKFSILDTEVSKVDDFIDSHSDSLVESGIFPTKEKASEWLSKRIKPRMEVKRTIYSETFSPERKAAAKGSSGAGKERAWVGEVEIGASHTATNAPTDASGYSMASAIRGEVPKLSPVVKRLPIGDVVDGRRQNMGARKFTDSSGESVEMFPQYIEQEGDEFYVVGKLKGHQVKEVTATGRREDKTTTTTTEIGDVRVPVSGNESALESYLGGIEWRGKFGGGTGASKYKPGYVEDGYEYIGGDPASQSSWKKLK